MAVYVVVYYSAADLVIILLYMYVFIEREKTTENATYTVWRAIMSFKV